jgi:hypothetical protein
LLYFLLSVFKRKSNAALVLSPSFVFFFFFFFTLFDSWMSGIGTTLFYSARQRHQERFFSFLIGSLSLSSLLTQKLHFRISYKKQKSAGACFFSSLCVCVLLFGLVVVIFQNSISSSSSPAVARPPLYISWIRRSCVFYCRWVSGWMMVGRGWWFLNRLRFSNRPLFSFTRLLCCAI